MNSTSQCMDKQIMDLSNFQSPHTSSNGNNDFIDFMNPTTDKKDDTVPSYDFMPNMPSLESSSPTAGLSSNLDSINNDVPLKTWNYVDSNFSASPLRNYSSPVADITEPANFVLGRNHKSSDVSLDVSLVSEIDRTMKKHMDNVLHVVNKMSARLTQLETSTRNFENSVDDLKVIIERNHDMTHGKMWSLENVLTEVQTGVEFIQDKHEIIEAELKITMLQIAKTEQVKNTTMSNPVPTQTGLPTLQQFSNPSLTQPPPPTLPPLSAPPPPPQHYVQPPMQQLPSQFPHIQSPLVSQQEPYYPPSPQNPENTGQQYQTPPPPPPKHQYQPPRQPPRQPQDSQLPSSQPHPSFSTFPQPPVGHHPEETPCVPSQAYSSAILPPFGTFLPLPPPRSQQYYRPNPNLYEPPSNRIGPGPRYSGSFGPSRDQGETYPYSSSTVESQQISSPGMGQSGYPHLPTGRILPQALPMASAVVGGSGSGSGNRVLIDDVVDRVTNMGFPREQVRATLRKLTENGQAVDLNVVLDKLMNDGNGQTQPGWFGR